MNLFTKLTTVPTNVRYPMTAKPILSLELSEGIEPEPSGFGVSMGYELRAVVVQSFRCNDAQKEHATKNATKALMHVLYSDFVADLYEVREAAYAGDTTKILSRIGEMLDEITDLN